jgi:hypothetical protein
MRELRQGVDVLFEGIEACHQVIRGKAFCAAWPADRVMAWPRGNQHNGIVRRECRGVMWGCQLRSDTHGVCGRLPTVLLEVLLGQVKPGLVTPAPAEAEAPEPMPATIAAKGMAGHHPEEPFGEAMGPRPDRGRLLAVRTRVSGHHGLLPQLTAARSLHDDF